MYSAYDNHLYHLLLPSTTLQIDVGIQNGVEVIKTNKYNSWIYLLQARNIKINISLKIPNLPQFGIFTFKLQ